MLELRVKAAALGIRSADFPTTPIEDILLGWEGRKLELYWMAVPQLDAQMAKMSPVALGKAQTEEESADDRKFAEAGKPIKARIERQAHFKLMPQFMQADHMRRFGLPWVDGNVTPINGLSRQLATDIIKLGESGRVPDSETYWRAFRRLRVKLYATVKEN